VGLRSGLSIARSFWSDYMFNADCSLYCRAVCFCTMLLALLP
jgi:hypothetical protein